MNSSAAFFRHRLMTGLTIGAIIAFPLGALGAKAYFTRHSLKTGVDSTPALAAEKDSGPLVLSGFDFDALRTADNDWSGPKPGEKIDLSRLRSKDGRALSDAAKSRPFVLVAVNPDCGMCRIATDEMIHLSKKFSGMGINYYVVSFPSEKPKSDFFEYSDSLKTGAKAFVWNAESGPPPEAVFKMTTPSHLLVSADGTVIRVWPGSYNDKLVRQRMARQILADTSVVLDTLGAVRKP